MPSYKLRSNAADAGGARGLLVTGDSSLAASAHQAYEGQSFDLTIAASGAEVASAVQAQSPQFAIIDLTSPIPDLLSEVRRFSEGGVSVLTLTETGGDLDRMLSLELGAEDSLSRPFSVREMLARTKVLVRRMTASPAAHVGDSVFGFAGWTFNQARRRLSTPTGQRVSLTLQNYLLLEIFLLHPEEPLHSDQIARWMGLDGRDQRIISTTVSRLRQRLSAYPGGADLIATVRGSGYVFQHPVTRSVRNPGTLGPQAIGHSQRHAFASHSAIG